MAAKRKYVEFTLKKYMPCWNLKKVSPLKMLLLNLTYQEVTYMEIK